MTTRKKIRLILIGLFINCLFVSAQTTTIDAELRPRSEFREGFKKPLADSLTPAFITL